MKPSLIRQLFLSLLLTLSSIARSGRFKLNGMTTVLSSLTFAMDMKFALLIPTSHCHQRTFTRLCMFPSSSSSSPSSSCSTVYVSGISTRLHEKEIADHFGQVGSVTNVSIPVNPQTNQRHGYALVTFEASEVAQRAVKLLHRSKLGKKSVQVRLDDLKREDERKRARLKLSVSRETQKASETIDKAFYTAKSIVLTRGMVEFSFPSGKYLMELLRLFHSNNLPLKYQSLIDILLGSKPQFNYKHAKGLTETIAMVSALKRFVKLTDIGGLGRHCDIQDFNEEQDARLFAVADGVAPYTAAAFNLLAPNQWHVYTIDPILNYDKNLLEPELRTRLHLVQKRTDDFMIPPKSNRDQISIVVACHSHCLLQEFWDRIEPPKIAIVMPCCNEAWSELNEMPVDIYEDFEVQSPRRKILLYYRAM